MGLTARALTVCCGFATAFTVLSARLIDLAVHQHEYYAAEAKDNSFTKVILPSWRGTIQDVNGSMLARNEPYKRLIADASLLVGERKLGKKITPFDQRPQAAELVAELLGMSTQQFIDSIQLGRRYIVLGRKVNEQVATEISRRIEAYNEENKKHPIKGLHFEQSFERIYPERNILSHVIGFYGFQDHPTDKTLSRWRGVEGIERSMDDWLSGQDGWRYTEKDGHGRELVSYRGEERAPRNGAHVRLTVDLALQQIVETELQAAFIKLKPIKASVIMMRPETGEILALANRPCFDSNEPEKAKPENRFNHAVAGLYEPGSTFKTVTAAGAINTGKASCDTEIWCENGRWKYGGKYLRDHHPYGSLTVAQIIEKSSNVGAAKLAIGLGEEKFYSLVRSFGFGQVTGIALPGEVRGILHPRDKWSNISITRVAIGHEVAATPLQVITATCAIANGGNLMMPQIIKDIRDDEGNLISEMKPQIVRTVVTPKTAREVTGALIRVTGKKGTAKLAAIPGFEVAGKTGTAQKIKDGRYVHDDHVTSFVGYVPAYKPALCMIVVVDEASVPSNLDAGGLVAAPIFKSIAEQALAYMGIEPDPELLESQQQNEKRLAKAQTR